MTERYECFGGPLDGEVLDDQGERFATGWGRVVDEDEDHARKEIFRLPGHYERTARGYEWRPD